MLYANYVISKKGVSVPYDVIALEIREPGKMKRKGKKFRRNLGSWSPVELEKFIEYMADGITEMFKMQICNQRKRARFNVQNVKTVILK